MFELTINDKVYPFNFGVGFVREINKTVKVEMSGVTEDAGLTMALTHIYDGDVVDLVNVLDLANKGKSPRVTKQELEAYIDDVIGFFTTSNATKKRAEKLFKSLEAAATE